MNYNINSSGLYDVNSYNLVSTNATILSSLNVSGLTTLSNDTNILGTLNVSGNTLLHNFITMNSPLYINTNQTTTISALSVNSTSVSVLVNIVQNAIWNDGVNYALNVSGYSMFGGVQINGQDSNHHIYKRVGDLTIASPSTHSIILKTNSGAWEAMRLNTVGTSINTSLYISGTTRLNNTTTCTSSLNVSGTTTLSNNVTCASSLNVSGTSNIGPLFINNFTGNTFLKIGTTGNILNITSNYSKYGISEDPEDTNIRMFKNAGIYHSVNYNTSGNTFHLFGDSTSNSYLKLEPLLNTSYNPLIVMGNTTMNSNLNILENIYAKNLPNVSKFNILVTQSVLINSSTFYKYDLDLRLYTTFVNPVPYILQRKFKFTCCLLSGALDLGLYNLNYDIDYNSVNYPSTGPQASLAQYNGINVQAYGFPYSNPKFDQITPNGLFIFKTDFNYITIFSKQQVNLLCIIINYLS